MKKILCLLLSFITLATLASLTAAFASVNAADNVIFISDNGKGDGSSPEKALGPGSNYNDESKWAWNLFKEAPINRAIGKLKNTGGTVVICGPVTLKWGMTKGGGVDLIPIGPDDGWGDKTITITSLHNGVDYRETNGAALIVYRNTTNKNSLSLQCPTVWKDVILRANHAVSNCVTANNWHLDCNRLTTRFESTFTTEAYIGSTKLNHQETGTSMPRLTMNF